MKHVWIQNNEGNRADLDLFLKKLNIGCRACYETYYCVVCCYTEEDSRIAWILLRIRSNGPHRLFLREKRQIAIQLWTRIALKQVLQIVFAFT
ncbi:unnamed protein product [Brassica oleracea]